MKTVLLNLPYKTSVIRRYMCSYNAPNFLFPPQELMGLASIVLKWKKEEAILLDAIAEKLNINQVIAKIKEFNADILVTISGFECFEEDMRNINEIKKNIPSLKVICFGHYPTIFPEEILSKVNIDFIILGEPDLIFSDLYDHLKENRSYKSLKGIAYRHKGKAIVNKPAGRILDLDKLPLPAHSLLNIDLYQEPFLGKPFSAITSSRGCPFNCNYCVKTYGIRIAFRSAESVLREIKLLVSKNIRNIRFMDDTFLVNKKRVIDICKLILENKIKIKWACLSRIDTLDEEALRWMKKAGCKRVYLGIESGSQKILDYYCKGYKVSDIIPKIMLVRKAKIESTGWFIVGSSVESREDFEKSIRLAKRSALDYIVVSKLIPYPGTPLFEKLKDDIEFSLLPYKNEFKDRSLEKKYKLWEKEFYRRFYLNPKNLLRMVVLLIFHPKQVISGLHIFLSYILSPIKGKSREDLF